MIEVGYCFPHEIGGLIDDSRIQRSTILDLYGFVPNATDRFQKCPVTQTYVRNTFLVNPSRNGSIRLNSYNSETDHFDLSGSFNPEEHEFSFRHAGKGRVLIQMRGMSIFFFTDSPNVQAVVQGTPQTNRPVIRATLDVSGFPRAAHPSFHCSVGDEIHLDTQVAELMITFITPDSEPVTLVPCSVPQIYRVTSELEAYNIRRKTFKWKEFFLRAKSLRMKNQVKKYRLEKNDL